MNRTSENYERICLNKTDFFSSKFGFQASRWKKLKQRLHTIHNTAWIIYTCNHKLTLQFNFFPALKSIDIYLKCISFYYLHIRTGKIVSTNMFLLLYVVLEHLCCMRYFKCFLYCSNCYNTSFYDWFFGWFIFIVLLLIKTTKIEGWKFRFFFSFVLVYLLYFWYS